uniref:BTB domain-containing protein n=1 Tax=Panagrellus redivivus TaxID=6233 RepID=A0A7E4ZW02_PANRE
MHRFTLPSATSTIILKCNESFISPRPILDGANKHFSPFCPIIGMPGYQWKIDVYTNGGAEHDTGVIWINVYVEPNTVNATLSFSIIGSDIRQESKWRVQGKVNHHYHAYIGHDLIRNSSAIKDGIFTIRCDAAFTAAEFSPNSNSAIETDARQLPLVGLTQDVDFDFTFFVGSQQKEVHRDYLSLISPVFRAMFKHDTKEARSGILTVDDFSFDVVTDVLDYCYGHPLKAVHMDEVMQCYIFADKYMISSVTKRLTLLMMAIVEDQLKLENFCSLVEFAWTYALQPLKEHCTGFYQQYAVDIVAKTKFAELDSKIVAEIQDAEEWPAETEVVRLQAEPRRRFFGQTLDKMSKFCQKHFCKKRLSPGPGRVFTPRGHTCDHTLACLCTLKHLSS